MYDRKTFQKAGRIRFMFWLALVFSFAQFAACGGPGGEPQTAAEAAGSPADSASAAATTKTGSRIASVIISRNAFNMLSLDTC